MLERVLLKGSKDSNNGVLGPKYHNVCGIWALKPYYLGPWTLRACLQEKQRRFHKIVEAEVLS